MKYQSGSNDAETPVWGGNSSTENSLDITKY